MKHGTGLGRSVRGTQVASGSNAPTLHNALPLPDASGRGPGVGLNDGELIA